VFCGVFQETVKELVSVAVRDKVPGATVGIPTGIATIGVDSASPVMLLAFTLNS
jgi:hypothetical protein